MTREEEQKAVERFVKEKGVKTLSAPKDGEVKVLHWSPGPAKYVNAKPPVKRTPPQPQEVRLR
jgi:hypothetical protein